jgi:hypothetical protein
MTQAENLNLIDASPTKDFFIYMLVKDIDLICAISDLIDNCVDGAKKLRENGDYSGLYVNIDISKKQFSISDNCGGISIEDAREKAFRFGRSSGSSFVNGSVGRFGVGMKRAIFKMGKVFFIESVTQSSRFSLEQDIEAWAKEEGPWDFEFKEVDPDYTPPPQEAIGTTIVVQELYESVSEEFSLNKFKTRLFNALSEDHQISLQRGLKISLNTERLRAYPIQLLSSPNIKPAYKSLSRENNQVTIKIYAGIIKTEDPEGKLEPSKAGWNIFCNERLMLKADKSQVTGWGSENNNPSFHNDYARFRGFTFLESSNPDLLPLNTTKNGIDADHPIYRSVRQELTKTMKPIVSFLRDIAKERRKRDDDDLSPLEKLIELSVLEPLSSLQEERSFTYEKLEVDQDEHVEKQNKIQYSKPESEVIRVKKLLGVSTLKDVGEKTFEYFLLMEGGD